MFCLPYTSLSVQTEPLHQQGGDLITNCITAPGGSVVGHVPGPRDHSWWDMQPVLPPGSLVQLADTSVAVRSTGSV